MVTECLYLTDSYLKECKSNVVTVYEEGNKIILDKTIIYPGGGGQPADRGFIAADGKSYAVLDIDKDDDDNFIYEIDAPIDMNTKGVTVSIDWEYRYMNMKYHTLLHIISGLLYEKYGALATSSKIESDYARLEIKFNEDNIPEITQEQLELEVSDIIKTSRPVTQSQVPKNELSSSEGLLKTTIDLVPENLSSVRVVTIEEVDQQACGGTHLNNTDEIQEFNIDKINKKGPAKKRIKVSM